MTQFRLYNCPISSNMTSQFPIYLQKVTFMRMSLAVKLNYNLVLILVRIYAGD